MSSRTSPNAKTPKLAAKKKTVRAPVDPALLSLRKIDHIQEQMSLLHGVMEELCERQEAMAMWHMEFAKKVFRYLDPQARKIVKDEFKEATAFIEDLSSDLRDRRLTREEFFRNSGLLNSELTESEEMLEEAIEKLVVLPEPEKPDYN